MSNLINSGNYSLDYLNDIKKNQLDKGDLKENGGDGDGNLSVNEAFNNLALDSVFNHLSGDGAEEKLNGIKSNVGNVLAKYAGDDGNFSAQEYADFLNGDEWNSVLSWLDEVDNAFYGEVETQKDALKLSQDEKQELRQEMNFIEQDYYNDGVLSKGEFTVHILNDLFQRGVDVDTSEIETLIDKYAGKNGSFGAKEYYLLKQDETFKNFLQNTNTILDKRTEEDKNVQKEMLEYGQYKNDKFLSKGEVKVSFIKQLFDKNIDTTALENVIDKYAGDDGVLSSKEYSKLSQNSIFKQFSKMIDE